MQRSLRWRLRIHGKVQGVAFRASMVQQARRLGLAGWVRNRRDGSVEALVVGEAAALEAILRWSRRGPPLAQVSHVAIESESEPGSDASGAAEAAGAEALVGFDQRPTA